MRQKKYYSFFGLIIFLYLAVLTGRSMYQNWQTTQEAKRIKAEIETLEAERENLQNLITYYQTKSFKEKEARRKLGLVKPDEKVVILSQETNPPQNLTKPISEEPKKANWQLWWDFFFSKKTTP